MPTSVCNGVCLEFGFYFYFLMYKSETERGPERLPVSRSKDYVRSGIKIGSVLCLCTHVSPSVPEMQGMYASGGHPI